MSASREKKARQELGADYVSPKEQKAREEAKSTRRSTAIFAVCAVLFLAFVIGMAVYNSGVLQRKAAAASVNGETVSAEDVSYYYYNTRASLLNSLSNLLDSQTSLREQTYLDGEQTWFDYTASQALETYSSVQQMVKAAKADGYDGGEELENEVKENLESLNTAASSNGYTTKQYLKAVFGSLMTPAAFERNLRASALASSYSDYLSDVSRFTEDELNAAREADPAYYDAVAVRHILVEDEETANSLLQQWQDGEATEDSFAALANENSTDPGSNTNGGLYENVTKGQMVAEFEDWCFDDARQSGDTGVVQTSYGYHVMYFVSRGLYSDWQTRAASKLAGDKIDAITGEADIQLLDGMKYIDN